MEILEVFKVNPGTDKDYHYIHYNTALFWKILAKALRIIQIETGMSFQMIWPNICKNRKESIEKNTENSKKIQQISSVLVSVVAVTNYQNILGLKQQKCITLQFWVSLGSNQGWQGYIPSEGSREKSVSLPFPASGSHSYSLSCGPPSIFKARNSNSDLSHITPRQQFSPCLPPPLFPDSCNYIGHTCISRIISLTYGQLVSNT